MNNFETKIKFRDQDHYFIYHACLEAGRIILKVDRDFKIRKRKKK
jgi:hypothetical protein